MCAVSLVKKSCLWLVVSVFLLTSAGHAAEKAAAPAPANNNQIIALQNAVGDPLKVGKVKLEYFGHMAFRITTPQGLTMLIDPWKNDPSGTWGIWFPKEFPMSSADISASTHAHYDHNALHRVKSHMVFDRVAGQWALADLKVTGIADKHQYQAPGPVMWTDLFAERGINAVPPNNPPVLDNTIFVVETGGLRIVHWGDNRPDAPESVYKAVGQPDVLILPIDDSTHILSYAQIKEITDKLNPRVIIPTHYLIKGVSSVASTLLPADSWVAKQPRVENMKSATILLDPANIKKRTGDVFYFGAEAIKP